MYSYYIYGKDLNKVMATQKRDLVTGVRRNFIWVSTIAMLACMYVFSHFAVVQADFQAQELRGDLFEIAEAALNHIIERPFDLLGGTIGYYGLGLVIGLVIMAWEYNIYIQKKNTMWEGQHGTGKFNDNIADFFLEFILDPKLLDAARKKPWYIYLLSFFFKSALVIVPIAMFRGSLSQTLTNKGVPSAHLLLWGVCGIWLLFQFVKLFLKLIKKPSVPLKDIGMGKSITTKQIRFHMENCDYGKIRATMSRIVPNTITDKELERCLDNCIIQSEHVRLSLNTTWTQRTLNTIVFGGTGTGKSRFIVKPNLLQACSSYVITDPKGELLRDCGGFLRDVKGYKIKVLNLKDLGHTLRYNPVHYCRSQDDIPKLVDLIIKNIDAAGGGKSSGGDGDFWTQSAKNIMMAVIAYLFEVYTDPNEFMLDENGNEIIGEDGKKVPNPHWEGHKNLINVINMLRMAEIHEDEGECQSDLDNLFAELAEANWNSYAVRQYQIFKTSGDKTALNILISTMVKLSLFDNDAFANVTFKDELELDKISTEKTALFVILPVNDQTYNFLASILFTQLFDMLYAQGDANGGSVEIPVQFILDEMANLGKIPNLNTKLATMRSYRISCTLIFQTLSQLKSYDKDDWSTLLGNCDTLIYLGGTEQELLKYLSERIGKMTIQSYSYGDSKSGGSSNRQVMGRAVLDPNEIEQMSNNDSLIFVRAQVPFFDRKVPLQKHKNYKYLGDSRKKQAIKYDIEEFKTAYEEDSIINSFVKGYSDPNHTVPRTLDKHIERDEAGNVVYAEFERLNYDGTKETRIMPKPKQVPFDNFSAKQAKRAGQIAEGATTWKDIHCSFILKGEVAKMPKSPEQISADYAKQKKEEEENAYNPDYWQKRIDEGNMYPVNNADMEDLLEFIREATGGKEFKCSLGDYLALYQFYEKENGDEDVRKYVDINHLEEIIENLEVVGGYSPDYEFRDEDFDESTFSISSDDEEENSTEEFSDEYGEEEEDTVDSYTDESSDMIADFAATYEADYEENGEEFVSEEAEDAEESSFSDDIYNFFEESEEN